MDANDSITFTVVFADDAINDMQTHRLQ